MLPGRRLKSGPSEASQPLRLGLSPFNDVLALAPGAAERVRRDLS